MGMDQGAEWGRIHDVLPSCGAAATYAANVAILDGIGECQIRQVSISATSTNFAIYILDAEAGALNSVNEVYENNVINLHEVDDYFLNGGRLIRNTDGVNCFWVMVVNADGLNATGPIDLRISFVGAKTL